jgi:hypothetical protein
MSCGPFFGATLVWPFGWSKGINHWPLVQKDWTADRPKAAQDQALLPPINFPFAPVHELPRKN